MAHQHQYHTIELDQEVTKSRDDKTIKHSIPRLAVSQLRADKRDVKLYIDAQSPGANAFGLRSLSTIEPGSFMGYGRDGGGDGALGLPSLSLQELKMKRSL